jgi:hypothetical protein
MSSPVPLTQATYDRIRGRAAKLGIAPSALLEQILTESEARPFTVHQALRRMTTPFCQGCGGACKAAFQWRGTWRCGCRNP